MLRWLTLIVLALAGCAGHQPFDRTYIARDVETRTGYGFAAEPPGHGFTLPPDVVLGDGLTEDDAVMTALWNNAQFHADLAELGIARADLAAAGQLPNPMLGLLFPWGPKQLEFTVSQAVSFLWQRPYRLAAARLDAERVADNLVQHGLRLVLRTRATHADLVAAEQQASLLEEQAVVLDEIAGIYEARLRSGDISELGVSTARLDAMHARDAVFQARFAADTTRHHLLTLLGTGAEAMPFDPVAVPVPEEGDMPIDLDSLVRIALVVRPDVRAAELTVEAAGKRVGLERAQVFNLIGTLDANAQGKEGFEAGPGLQIELPLFSQNQGGRLRARAEMERALRQYVARQHAVIQDVRDATAASRATAEAFAYWHGQIVPELEAALARTERMEALGEAAHLSVLEKQRQLLEARIQEARMNAALRKALAHLHYSVGTKPVRNTETP